MRTPRVKNNFCFFYAPGVNHDEATREEFYDELRTGVDKYTK